MSRNIFKSEETMPLTSNSPDVVRTALSPGDVVNMTLTEGGIKRTNIPAALFTPNDSVKHVERPVRGRPY